MNSGPKIGFVSLGCPKALVDSERILSRLKTEGYQTAPDYAGADVVVVNTCGFLDSARDESLEAIGEAMAENGRGKPTQAGHSSTSSPKKAGQSSAFGAGRAERIKSRSLSRSAVPFALTARGRLRSDETPPENGGLPGDWLAEYSDLGTRSFSVLARQSSTSSSCGMLASAYFSHARVSPRRCTPPKPPYIGKHVVSLTPWGPPGSGPY